MAYVRSTRVDPRDFQVNTAIGVGLPFNAPGVFNSIYSTREQIKFNVVNLVLTSKGERIENPNFGTTLRSQLFTFHQQNIIHKTHYLYCVEMTYLPLNIRT